MPWGSVPAWASWLPRQSDPRTVARAGDVVRVKVMSIDKPRRRVALTLRLDDPLPVAGEPGGPAGGGRFRR